MTRLNIGCIAIVAASFLAAGAEAMSPDDIALRNSLKITAPASPISIRYKPVSECVYGEDLTGGAMVDRSVLRIRAIKDDRLQAVLTSQNGQQNIAIIDSTGYLFDWNVPSASGNERFTPARQGEIAAQLAMGEIKSHDSRHVLPRLNFYLPQYDMPSAQTMTARQRVAIVTNERSMPWGSYTFAGMTTYKGVTVAVLDLYNNAGAMSGFNIVDLRSGLPLLSVFDAGLHVRFEQQGCKP